MATEMKPKIEQIENLARLHRQTTGNEVDITMLTTKWEDMTILLRSHDQIARLNSGIFMIFRLGA